MEFVERNTPAKGKELRGVVPSGAQPHELSRRLDSSSPMLRGDAEMANKASSEGTDRPAVTVIDRKLVDEANNCDATATFKLTASGGASGGCQGREDVETSVNQGWA